MRRMMLNGGVGLGRAATLLALDAAALALALFAALLLKQIVRGQPLMPGMLWRVEANWLPFVILVVGLVFARSGLYRGRDARPGGGEAVSGLALATLVIAIFALATGHQFQSYLVFPTALIIAAILIPLFRESYDDLSCTAARTLGLSRAVVVSAPMHLASDGTVRARHRGYDVRIVRVADESRLPWLIREVAPYEVLLGSNPSETTLLETLEACHAVGTHLRVLPGPAELMAHGVLFVPGHGIPLLDLREPAIKGLSWIVKRGFDVSVSLASVILLAPLFAIIAVAIRMTSSGPILYRSTRIGVGERSFSMLKFRSMRTGADEEQAELEHQNDADGVLFKMRDDPRVTPVGKVIRRLSLDELPQLVNVLRGEMSLVGPRPLPPRDYDRLEPWQRQRSLVVPGVTGPWQISGRGTLSSDDMVRLDFHYLEHWSLWLDIAILARTPAAVLLGRGAY